MGLRRHDDPTPHTRLGGHAWATIGDYVTVDHMLDFMLQF